MTNFEEALTKTRQQVDTYLHSLIHAWQGRIPVRLSSAMAYSLMTPGKRFRPFLTLNFAELLGGTSQQALPVAAAIEMVHCYSLIHDDLPAMDNASLRRGQPTVHVKFDEATALLAGNSLLAEGLYLLSDTKTHSNPQTRLELIQGLLEASGGKGMMGGQMLDMESSTKFYNLSEIEHLQNLKTGAMIAFSCAAAGLIMHVQSSLLKNLEKYGYNLGLAYQIRDDLMDVESTALVVGKPVGQNQQAQKPTFVSLLGVEGARKKAEDLVEECLSLLESFGPKSDLLRSATLFVLHRAL